MGRKPSISEAQGAQLLDAYQRLGDKRAAMREVGVSESAGYRFFENLGENIAPVVATQRQIIEKAGASLFDTRAALEENYGRLLTLMTQLEAGILEERQGSDGPYTTMTPISVHVAALRELREHIKTGMDLQKLLIDVAEVQKFQQAVIEAIGEADPATQQRILAKLKQRRAVGLALQHT